MRDGRAYRSGRARTPCYPRRMDTPANDIAHLLTLIEAARDEAERLGPRAGGIAGRLQRAAVEARSIASHGGQPAEGLRPEELTTGNDL